MARPLRVEYPGAFYHVISRGNSGAAVFKTDRDRKRFLDYLQNARERFSLLIHAYCLMNNHYHLLIETPQANLSQTIQWVNISYASYFNKKHSRNGHLFQGRFKALLVDADEYLVHLSRYIHLNPVQAGIVAVPDQYPWSSYGTFAGKVDRPDFLTTDEILSRFGVKEREAVRAYRKCVEETDIKVLKDPYECAMGGFILGDADFVHWVQETFLSMMSNDKEIPQLKKLRPKIALEIIVQEVCKELSCQAVQILARGRKGNKARGIAIYLAREMSGEKGSELGRYFGNVSGALITMTTNRLSREMVEDKKLEAMIQRIKKRIFNI